MTRHREVPFWLKMKNLPLQILGKWREEHLCNIDLSKYVAFLWLVFYNIEPILSCKPLKDNAKNKNTQKSTNNWINVWTNQIFEAERVNLARQNKNNLSAVCLKIFYVYY